MAMHITRLNGHRANSTTQIAQQNLVDIAKQLGFHEMNYYFFDANTDTDEQLIKRIEGCISAVSKGDIVIFQTPTWMGTRYENYFLQVLKAYECKIIVLIHDVIPFMWRENNGYLMKDYIAVYNYADVIVVPSKNMYDYLVSEGLTVKKYVVQHILDQNIGDMYLGTPSFKKQVFFTGNSEHSDLVKNWNSSWLLRAYAKPLDINNTNVKFEGWVAPGKLFFELAEGGFGYVEKRKEWVQDYFKCYVPYKLGVYLASGLPVIVHSDLACVDIIRDNHLGIVVDSIEDAIPILENMTEEEYNKILNSVRNFRPLVANGFYTKKFLAEAVHQVLSI